MKILYMKQKLVGTALGTLSVPMINIIIVFLVSRYVDKELYGQFLLIMTLIQGVAFILLSGFGASVGRYINDFIPSSFLNIYGFLYTIALIILIISMLVLLNTFYAGQFSYHIQILITLVAISLPILSFDISVLNFREYYLRYGFIRILFAFCTLLLPILGYFLFKSSLETMLYFELIGIAIMFLVLFISKKTILTSMNLRKKNFNSKIVKYAVIVTVSSVASWTISFSDRILVESFLGSSVLTLFVLNTQIAGIVGILSSMISIYFFPSIFKNFHDNPSYQFKKSLKIQLFVILLLTLSSILYFYFGKELLIWVLDDSYVETSFLLVYYLLVANSLLIFINFASVFLSILDQMKFNSIGYIIGAFLNLMINFIFLKEFGMITAAISTLIAYAAILFFVDLKLFFLLRKHKIEKVNE